MKTKTYNVYKFSELEPKARERAIADHAQFLGETWDGENTITDAMDCLVHAGFVIDKILYTGFWSQGDGACFTGHWQASAVNPERMRQHAPMDQELHRIADALAKLAAQWPEAFFTVRHVGHYYHRYSTSFVFELIEDRMADLPVGADEAEAALTELARDAMQWIYRQLEKDYDWATAEAQVIESIEANGYDFTSDGKID